MFVNPQNEYFSEFHKNIRRLNSCLSFVSLSAYLLSDSNKKVYKKEMITNLGNYEPIIQIGGQSVLQFQNYNQ
jgi:hypothetical protein